MNLTGVQEKDLSAGRVLPVMGKWHPGTISASEPAASSKGGSMIKAQVTLVGEGHEGYTIYHNFMTDGTTKGGSFSKKQLIGCGIDVSKEQADEEVAGQLLGKDVFVMVRHEVIKDKDANGAYTQIRYDTDNDGKQVPAKKAVAIAFSLYDPNGAGEKKAETPAPPAKESEKAEGNAAPPTTDGGKPKPSWMAGKGTPPPAKK